MNRPPERIEGVNDALAAEAMPAIGARAETVPDSFEVLYRRSFPRVYAYVASLLRDRAAAEDVTAQAFERAYRKRRSFRPSRGSADAWLMGIARNAALDELRRRRRTARLEHEPEDPLPAAPDDEVERGLRRASVRAALEKLDPRDRDLIALRFAAGLSHAEIARVLGMSETNAGTKLHRAIETLRKACHEGT
jgi:RNA polymerase sigma-70 factor, ECF subfamily